MEEVERFNMVVQYHPRFTSTFRQLVVRTGLTRRECMDFIRSHNVWFTAAGKMLVMVPV